MRSIWFLVLAGVAFSTSVWADTIEARYRAVLEPCGLHGTDAFRIQRCAQVNDDKTDDRGVKLRDALKSENWALVTVLPSLDRAPMMFWKDLSEGGRVWSGALYESVPSREKAEEACAEWERDDGFFPRDYFRLASVEEWSKAFRSRMDRVMDVGFHWFRAWQICENAPRGMAVRFEEKMVMHSIEIPMTFDGIEVTSSLHRFGSEAIRCVH